jgi:sulfite exporter TauE/SafE
LRSLRRPAAAPWASLLAPARQLLARLAAQRTLLAGVALGSLMGFLPCMFVLWALGLCATTASPLHGALIMVLLVAMTTPVLFAVTLLPRLLIRRRAGSWLAARLPALSGLWLLLAGGAALGLWPHAHAGVSLLGRGFLIMLF